MSLTFEQFEELNAKYENGSATAEDLEALEPYRAKRAVLLASGFGSRMLPITLNTPKPLVNVNGRRIITTILDALLAIDVQEIYIVTGYLKECFQNAYVFESDLFLSNPSLLKKYRYQSCYMGVSVEQTPDWCFDVTDGRIMDLHKGGTNCYHMYGISYWTAEDGAKLAVDLPECFDADDATKQRFWDDVPCCIRHDNYHLAIVPCTFDDVAEIDSFVELQEIDPRYRI